MKEEDMNETGSRYLSPQVQVQNVQQVAVAPKVKKVRTDMNRTRIQVQNVQQANKVQNHNRTDMNQLLNKLQTSCSS